MEVVIINMKKMRYLSFWAGTAKLQFLHVQKLAGSACSKGGVFGPLMSKGHWVDILTSAGRGLIVLTSLNWLEHALDTTDSEFLKNNLLLFNQQTSYCLSNIWRMRKSFVATVKASWQWEVTSVIHLTDNHALFSSREIWDGLPNLMSPCWDLG